MTALRLRESILIMIICIFFLLAYTRMLRALLSVLRLLFVYRWIMRNKLHNMITFFSLEVGQLILSRGRHKNVFSLLGGEGGGDRR